MTGWAGAVRTPGQYLFNLFIQKPYHYICLIFGDCRARGERRLRCIVEECWIYYLAASKERIQNNVSRCISCWWVQYLPESYSFSSELSGTLDRRCYSTVLSLSALQWLSQHRQNYSSSLKEVCWRTCRGWFRKKNRVDGGLEIPRNIRAIFSESCIGMGVASFRRDRRSTFRTTVHCSPSDLRPRMFASVSGSKK
jgi:hypothetical protein